MLFLVTVAYYGIAAAKGPAKGLPVRVLVNGREVDFPDATPFLDEHNRVQAPVRFVARELGARGLFKSNLKLPRSIKPLFL